MESELLGIDIMDLIVFGFIPLTFYILFGYYCFKKKMLKPIYTYFTIGLCLSIIFFLVGYFCLKLTCRQECDLAGFAILAPIVFFINPIILSISLILGTLKSYKKTKNKKVFLALLFLILILGPPILIILNIFLSRFIYY